MLGSASLQNVLGTHELSKSWKTSKVCLRLWSVYPLLVPFYLMGKTPVPGTEKVEGGVPQLADYYLVGLMALVFGTLPFRLHRRAVSVVGALICFVGYTAVVNMTWAGSLEDLSLLTSTVYYAYDVLLLLTCLVLHANYKDEFLYVTVQAVGVSVVLQALLSPFAPHQIYARQPVFFNNENQLGYFCLLAATIFIAGSRRFAIGLRYQIIFYAALTYLALLSQSRGALLGLISLLLLSLLGRPVRLLVALGAVVSLYVVLSSGSLLPKSEERLVAQGEYDTAGGRGYDRIVNHPEYNLFGAGEGVYERFRSELYATEIHSSYGTLLFSYGIPGVLLFTLALFFICRHYLWNVLYLIPAFVHGMGHHGLRFAFFWVMLAFMCCQGMGGTDGE